MQNTRAKKSQKQNECRDKSQDFEILVSVPTNRLAPADWRLNAEARGQHSPPDPLSTSPRTTALSTSPTTSTWSTSTTTLSITKPNQTKNSTRDAGRTRCVTSGRSDHEQEWTWKKRLPQVKKCDMLAKFSSAAAIIHQNCRWRKSTIFLFSGTKLTHLLLLNSHS